MSLKIPFSMGLNTARDPSELARGEMTQATGVYYKDGDSRAHKVGGVTTYADTSTAKKIDGVGLLLFDSGGTDKLVALSNQVLYGSTITSTGSSGTLTSLKSGLLSGADSLSAAHSNDKWYLGFGTENLVVESDGTTRTMGMAVPGKISFNAFGTNGTGTSTRPSSATGETFTAVASAYDADLATYAELRKTAAGTFTTTFAWSGTSDTGTGRNLNVKWGLSGSSFTDEFNYETSYDDTGSTSNAGFSVNVKMEVSEDAGTSWATVLDNQFIRNFVPSQVVTYPVTDSLEVADLVQVKVTFTYNSGTNYASLRLYDLAVQKGSEAADISADTGMYYAVTEYDDVRGLESPAVAIDKIIKPTTKNSIIINLPASATNSNATHYRVYRTTDGGSTPSSLSFIGTAPITDTTWTDTLVDPDKDTNGSWFYPLLRVLAQQDSGGASPLYFDQNSPPPACSVFRTFEGSLVGFSEATPRALFYSMAGLPESWPEINVISTFPFEEHDELVDGVSLGSIFLLAAKGLMMRLTGLPRAVNSVRDNTRIEQLKGAPGCVGRKALTAYSVGGEPRAAWISPYGIYITNGDTIQEVSGNIDWDFDGFDKSDWVLEWDANRLCLMFCYSSVSGGVNDRYYLLHMAPEHQTADGRQPKWTGPHYGSFNALASGQVASAHRLYGGHSSNGIAYVLDNGATDSSQPYSSTQVPLIVKTGKIYADEGDDEWSALDAVLFHTDFGGGQTCTLNWEAGNDHETGSASTISQAVALSGHQGTQLDISQRCQWAQATVTHTGAAEGALRDLAVRVKKRGERGGKRYS